jgi:branched-chain amino acid transport system substrate-binding protein
MTGLRSIEPPYPSVFKIAVIAPLSGRGARLGREMVQAAQLALDDALEAGGVPGIRFELWTLNDKGNEREGVRIAHQITKDERVLGAVGHYNSNVTLQTAPIYYEGGLPLVSPIVSNPKLTESGWSNIFRFTNRDDATAAALVGYLMQQLGKRRVVVVETDTVYGHSMTEEFVQAFQRNSGRVLARLQVPEGRTEFDDMVRSWPKDFDLAFYGGTFEGAPLLHAMRDLGLQQLLATGDGCWDVANFLEPAGRAAEQGEGVLVLSACEEIGKVPGSRDFAERYKAQYGPIINYAALAYDATAMLIKSVKSAVGQGGRPVTRQGVLSVLRRSPYHGIAYREAARSDARGDNMAAVTALHVVRQGRFEEVHCNAHATQRCATSE